MTKSEPGRPRRIWRFFKILSVLAVLLLVVSVPAVAFGLPAAAKTKWARARIEKALARLLGAPVQIGKVEASWKQGMTLRDVSCKPANYGKAEVTLAIREMRFKPSYGKLLRGKVRAGLVLAAPDVRIRECSNPGAPAEARLPRLCRKEIKIESLRISEGVFAVTSDRFNGTLSMEGIDLEGALVASRGRADAEVTKLSAKVNGGTLTGQGLFAVSRDGVKSRIDVQGKGVESNELVARVLRYLTPLFETSPAGSVRGRLDVRFKAEGEGKDIRAMLRSAQGEGAFLVREGDLRGSRILAAAGGALANPALSEARFHEAEGLLTLREGRVNVPDSLARGPAEVHLSGWVDLDGAMAYAVDLRGAAPAVVRVGGTLAEPRVERDTSGEPH